MSEDISWISFQFPPENRRKISERIAREICKSKPLLALSRPGGMSPSQFRQLAEIFQKAEGLDRLNQNLEEFCNKMQQSNSPRRKEQAEKMTGFVKNIVDALLNRYGPVVSAWCGINHLDADTALLMLKKEIFLMAWRVHRYQQACDQWRSKGEVKCLPL